MKESIYSVERRESGRLYLHGTLITPRNARYAYLFPWVNDFADHDPQHVRLGRITDSAGVYAVVEKTSGAALYAGQSFHMARRREQHLAEVAKAKQGNPTNRCYEYMAAHPGEWRFASLYRFPKKAFNALTLNERRKLLSVAEQWAFDTLHPRFNVTAARKSAINTSFRWDPERR